MARGTGAVHRQRVDDNVCKSIGESQVAGPVDAFGAQTRAQRLKREARLLRPGLRLEQRLWRQSLAGTNRLKEPMAADSSGWQG